MNLGNNEGTFSGFEQVGTFIKKGLRKNFGGGGHLPPGPPGSYATDPKPTSHIEKEFE